jgi:hypothetical protein
MATLHEHKAVFSEENNYSVIRSSIIHTTTLVSEITLTDSVYFCICRWTDCAIYNASSVN